MVLVLHAIMRFLQFGESSERHTALTKIFAESVADLNAKNLDGETALHIGCSNRSNSVLELVKLGCDVDSLDFLGNTALIRLLDGGNSLFSTTKWMEEITSALVSRGKSRGVSLREVRQKISSNCCL